VWGGGSHAEGSFLSKEGGAGEHISREGRHKRPETAKSPREKSLRGGGLFIWALRKEGFGGIPRVCD